MSLASVPRSDVGPRSEIGSWFARSLAAVACCLGVLSPPAKAERSLFVMDRDGANVRHVGHVNGFTWMGSPRSSRDGRMLVFDGRNPKVSENRVFAIGVDGSGLRDVGPGGFADWSPDDRQFAFSAAANDSLKPGIYVQNVDGRGKQHLSPGIAPRWSPDGSQLAFRAGGLKIYDLVDGTNRTVLDAAKIKNGFDWSPDGARLAAIVELADGTREVVIVDATKPSPPRTRWKGAVDDVAWSPDGLTLAVSIVRRQPAEHRICLMRADGDDEPVEIPGQQGDTREVAWSFDGRQLAFTSSRRDIEWRPTSIADEGAELELVRSYDKGGTVYSVGLTPDGRTAFIGGDMTNRGVVVWNATNGEARHRIDNIGVFVAVSPDGKHGACAPFLGASVDLINLEDGSRVDSFNHGSTVSCLDFSGDGSRLVTAGMDKAACTFDVASSQRLTRIEHPAEIKRVAFSPNGKLIAVSCGDNKLYLWNAESGQKVREMDHPACPWGVAFSPDGAQVATGTGGILTGKPSSLMIQPEADNTLRIWEVETGKLLREMKGHTHTISSIAYSPDGRRIVTAGLDRTLRLWDAESGLELARAQGEGWFTDAVFSSDGKLILAGGGAEKRFDERRWYEYPKERVRLFRVVTADEPAN